MLRSPPPVPCSLSSPFWALLFPSFCFHLIGTHQFELCLLLETILCPLNGQVTPLLLFCITYTTGLSEDCSCCAHMYVYKPPHSKQHLKPQGMLTHQVTTLCHYLYSELLTTNVLGLFIFVSSASKFLINAVVLIQKGISDSVCLFVCFFKIIQSLASFSFFFYLGFLTFLIHMGTLILKKKENNCIVQVSDLRSPHFNIVLYPNINLIINSALKRESARLG